MFYVEIEYKTDISPKTGVLWVISKNMITDLNKAAEIVYDKEHFERGKVFIQVERIDCKNLDVIAQG